jgi:DNA-binding CsgD family transcriptional regulator
LPLDLVEGRWEEARALAHMTFGDHSLPAQNIRSRVFGALGLERGDEQLAAAFWADVQNALPDGPATEPGQCDFENAVVALRLSADFALEAGELEEACAWLEAHDRWLAWSGAVRGRAEAHLLWARYHRLAGEPQIAHRHAEQALLDASDPRQPLALIAAQRFLGRLESEAGNVDQAAGYLAASLELAVRCQAPYERAQTLLVMAELAAHSANTDRARQLLREVRQICEPLEAKRTLDRIHQIEQRLQAPSDFPAGLSAREVEVLEHAATGLTNIEIGEALFISPRTAAQHLRSVYNKLGVNSRAAAVGRWADLRNT